MYKVLVADAPWPFNDKLPGKNRGVAKNYKTMPVNEIARFPLPPLAPDCILFFWRVASMQQEALDVIWAWGFSPVKTELIWLKKTSEGQRWFGMGRTLRAEHEVCLIATRGRPQLLNHSTRTTFVTDVTGFSAQAGRHSEKPDAFYEIVEKLSEGPYVELFARRQRAGWTCLGDELTPEVSDEDKEEISKAINEDEYDEGAIELLIIKYHLTRNDAVTLADEIAKNHKK